MIGHYRELITRAADRSSRKSIHLLIEKLEDDKKALHLQQS